MDEREGKGANRGISPLDLELVHEASRATLRLGGKVVLTPEGGPVQDETTAVVEAVLDDLRALGRLVLVDRRLEVPRDLTCYEIHVRYEKERMGDAGYVVGPTDTALEAALKTVPRGDEIESVLKAVEDLRQRYGGERDWRRVGWKELDAAGRAVVRTLQDRHGTAFAIMLALAVGRIDGKQYARAVWHIRERSEEAFRAGDAAWQHRYFEQIRRDAWRAERYLGARVGWVETLARRGESAGLEFKATLRKNLKTGRVDGAVLGACLKTLAGFLNGDGGTLIIGVTDEGVPVKELLVVDELKNEDRFLRLLFSKMRDAVGAAISTGVTARFETFEGSSVCVVTCARSSTPVFLRGARNTEEFCVRNGPSTESLSIREAVGYIRRRFPQYEGHL